MSMIQISKRQKGTSKLVDVLIRIGAIVLSLIFILSLIHISEPTRP